MFRPLFVKGRGSHIIVVKIKCVDFDRINAICDKVNFITNYTHFTTPDNILSKHTQIITIFDTFGGTALQRDLRISP
jgi:hypothetical protein